MANVTIPYPNPGVAAFDVLDTYLQSFLFTGSDPKPLTFGGFQIEENTVLLQFMPVGLNARKKLVPATVTDATTYFVANVAIVNGGASGVNGPAVVTGTTGTGTKFQANVIIAAGAISQIVSMAVEGSYTVQPTTPAVEPVTGASLVGATLALTMEPLEVATPGVQAIGITTEAITTAVGDDQKGIPLFYSGCFNIRALNWDASFATDHDKYMAFMGAPSPTQILIKKRQSDV